MRQTHSSAIRFEDVCAWVIKSS